MKGEQVHGYTYDFSAEMYKDWYLKERFKPILKIAKERFISWFTRKWNEFVEKLYL